jgi:hypothetical protein
VCVQVEASCEALVYTDREGDTRLLVARQDGESIDCFAARFHDLLIAMKGQTNGSTTSSEASNQDTLRLW